MVSIDQFKKLGIKDLAARLGIHPFNVVRILTAKSLLTPDLHFEEDDVEKVRRFGGVEYWWTGSCEIIDDSIRARGVLRSIVRELLRRGLVGETTTRADNIYRGLEPDDERVARRALNVLIQEQLVRTLPTPLGIHVSAAPEQRQALERLAEGREIPPALAVLWLG
ncbi:MAG: hypothetical protein ABIO70_22490 [Pseudomonadota bacterium]